LGVLIIDEAQDLSQLQWQLVFELIRRADQTYIAGDDDQAVYVWAGADVQTFLGIEGEIKILEKSYRVPALIHNLANRVVNRIRTRQDKTWSPREEVGVLKTYDRFESVDLTTGEWLVLASTNYMLNDVHEWIKSQGLLFERYGQRSVSEKTLIAVMGWETLRKGNEIDSQTVEIVYRHLGTEFVKRGHKSLKTLDPEKLYTIDMLEADHGLLTRAIWHEVLTKISENQRSYIISLLRRGVKLTGDVPIRLSTIHGAKGGEADNVLLITDLSPKFANEYAKNSDDINRLLYVGITRARQSLHIILPKNEQKGFRF
jgi:DNA helicase-2/ATP-dependent DNA helicase PcrA